MQNSVVNQVLDTMERHPAAAALVTPQQTWCYADLGRLIGAASDFIGSAGLSRGDRVAILLPNSVEYVATYLGTHLAGCVAVALNTQEPAGVIARLIGHCGAKLLFVDANFRDLDRLAELLDTTRMEIVRIGGDEMPWDDVAGATPKDVGRLGDDVSSDELASLIYTSGTTGNPKGVMLSHRNLAANTASILEYLDISHTDRTLNVLPFYYSFGNSILMTHLVAGACIVLQNNIAFPHAVLRKMSKEQVTGFYGVPTTFTLLFDPKKIGGADLSSLRYIAQAGGPMSVDKQQQLKRDLPDTRIFVMYGQTEATARLTYLDPERLDDKSGSVGKAIPGVTLRVGASDDGHHNADAPGEVYASGDNIMLGYWNDEAASAGVLCDGWLRTGDLGYFDEDGFLYLTGRASDMIKTGANRISPAEIEDVISRFDGVSEVGAFAIGDDILGQAVAVAIVQDNGARLDEQDIRRYCLAEMSHYKIPKYIEFVGALPKTASGKLKRHVLAKDHEEKVEQ